MTDTDKSGLKLKRIFIMPVYGEKHPFDTFEEAKGFVKTIQELSDPKLPLDAISVSILYENNFDENFTLPEIEMVVQRLEFIEQTNNG